MKELDIALSCCEKAGKEIMKYFGKTGYKLKGRANPVTKADIVSQKIITSMILKKFPSDTVISEENYTKVNKFDRVWFIDPLDGTVNFSHSFTHFAISIAFVYEGSSVIGVIYDPFKDELFAAEKNKGAWLNGKRIFVSGVKDLYSSLLATGFAYDRAEKAEFYCSFYSEFLKLSHDIRRCGAASLDMAYVACGRLDGYWEFNLKPWDVSAGRVIVEEAGGKVSDFSGDLWKSNFDSIMKWGYQTLATNSKIHKQMVSVINRIINRFN